MPMTSKFHEKLVQCDVAELKVPACEFFQDDMIPLKGASSAQTTFAASVRIKKMAEWKPDLPMNVLKGLSGVADATWWLANQQKDAAAIGWPESWVAIEESRQPELGQLSPPPPASLNEARDRVLGIKPLMSKEIEEFDAFAKMACRSPEMSYMTMMALLYRQTKDPAVLAKYNEARRKVAGYIDGIETILGIPK